jgi:hypothetical protein
MKNVAPKPYFFRSGATTEYWLAVASSNVKTTIRSGICFRITPENAGENAKRIINMLRIFLIV